MPRFESRCPSLARKVKERIAAIRMLERKGVYQRSLFAPEAKPEISFDNGFTFVVNDGAVSECANDTRGCRRIYLTGAGQKFSLQPRAPLLPEGVDFGEVALGCESGQKPVLLINESSATLNVSSVLTNRPEFETLSSPTKIDPWSTGTIYVRFVPSAEGPLTGKLSVTDDVGGRTYSSGN